MGLSLLANRWILVGLAIAAALGFGAIQTFNLRACQQQYAKALADYTVAIEKQNSMVIEWQQKATQAQARAAQAGKKAAEATRIAKQRESAILQAPGPTRASCEERERATLDLLRRYRATP